MRLDLDVSYDLRQGEMRLWVLSPEGAPLFETSYADRYGRAVPLSLDEGLHSVVLGYRLEDGNIVGDRSISGRLSPAGAQTAGQTAGGQDTVIRYPTPGTPGNHSAYTDEAYAALMALQTDDYRLTTVGRFRDIFQEKHMTMLYTGYNPNDENVGFLKTLQYTQAELEYAANLAYGIAQEAPGVLLYTASNKRDAAGGYYGAELGYWIYWEGTEQLTVGERDDALNTAIEQCQSILEQKTRDQIGDTADLQADLRRLAESLSTARIKLSFVIEAYQAAQA